jgi:hypothetical protein
MSQAAMIEALRKKRLAHDASIGDPSDGELAPEPNEAHQGPDTRDEGKQNINASGMAGGLSKKVPPHQSEDEIVNTKKNIHLPEDKMKDEMISGTGAHPQTDHLGVDSHQLVKPVGGQRTQSNLKNGKEMKAKVAGDINSMMKTNQNPGMDMDDNDSGIGAQEVKGRFDSPKGRLTAGSDDDGDSGSSNETGVAPEPAKMKGLGKARQMIEKKFGRK